MSIIKQRRFTPLDLKHILGLHEHASIKTAKAFVVRVTNIIMVYLYRLNVKLLFGLYSGV